MYPLQHLFPAVPLQLTPTLSILFLIFLLFYIAVITNLSRRSTLPPSPWKLPFIGNLHQLAGPLPHRSLRRLSAQHGPLMLLRLGRVPTLVVSSAEAAREIMQSQDAIFANRPSLKVPTQLLYGCTDVAFAPHGDYWRRARKACVRHLLGPKQVHSYRLVREQEVHRMIQSITDHLNSPSCVPSPSSSHGAAPIKLSEVLSSFAKEVISRIVLGRCTRDNERWSHDVDVLVEECNELLGSFHVGDYFPFLEWWGCINGLNRRVSEAFKRIDGILEEVVVGRRRRRELMSGDDGCFVDVLLGLHNNYDHTRGGEGELSFSKDNIKALLEDLFGAGADSTIIVLEWAMAELIRNNKVMEKLQNELRGSIHNTKNMIKEDDLNKMSYLKAVVKETMRLHPPGPLLVPRELMKSTQIHGYNIPSKPLPPPRRLPRPPRADLIPGRRSRRGRRRLRSRVGVRGHAPRPHQLGDPQPPQRRHHQGLRREAPEGPLVPRIRPEGSGRGIPGEPGHCEGADGAVREPRSAGLGRQRREGGDPAAEPPRRRDEHQAPVLADREDDRAAVGRQCRGRVGRAGPSRGGSAENPERRRLEEHRPRPAVAGHSLHLPPCQCRRLWILFGSPTGEDEASQELAASAKRLPRHHTPDSKRAQISVPRVGGNIPPDHIHSSCIGCPGAAAAVPNLLHPQHRRLPTPNRRIQDLVQES